MNVITKLCVALLALTGAGIAGCNTFKGAGQDVSAAGRSIEGAAEDTQDEMTKKNKDQETSSQSGNGK